VKSKSNGVVSMSSSSKKVTCLLCSRVFVFITETHLRKHHDISFEEYRARFPDAVTRDPKITSNTNAKISKAKRVKAASLTPEERKAQTKPMRDWRSALSAKEFARFRKRNGKAIKAAFDCMSDEELQTIKKSRNEARVRRIESMSAEEFADMRLRQIGRHGHGAASSIERKMIKNIKSLGYEVKHHFKVGTVEVDAYIPELNLVLEMFGDYWHASPGLFDGNDRHPTTGKKIKSIWKHDKKRADRIREAGYRMEVIWESELKQNGFKATLRPLLTRLANAHDNTEPRRDRKARKV
jgi:G:T-mismatch repair DNA endonuclease (very short patch repair protein)